MKTGISWLDVKLGIRMLLKYPGLSLVGGLGMAVAIAISAGMFAFFYTHMSPDIPLDQGARVVAIENWDTRRNNEERHQTHDFAAWKTELRTVRDVGAFRTVTRNVIGADGQAQSVALAEMTASGFRVARVRPALGRHLVDEDEREGAPPVVVIGHDVWETRFASDPAVVGQPLRLGNGVHTVVGVMPAGFAFPVNHAYWVPLRLDPTRVERGKGPQIHVFGRLAPGVTREQAQAEVAALGTRAAAAFPRTHAHLRPRVMPYTYPLLDIQDVSVWSVAVMQMTVSLLLLVVAVNVAVLVYARTATRRGEIAVRTALGASRGRIVGQLFAEALVLSAAAAVAGLLLTRVGLRMGHRIMALEGGPPPFWLDGGIPPLAIAYTVGLAVLAAVIVGVLPALQATGGRMQASLRQLGGGSGLRLGRTWTVLIVAQVALAVAAIPIAVDMGWSEVRTMASRPEFDTGEILAAGVGMDPEPPPGVDAAAFRAQLNARFGALQTELVRRLQAEPAVARVTWGAGLPGDESGGRVEVEGAPPGGRGHMVRINEVEPGYFTTFGARLLAGRPWNAGDADSTAATVMVSRSFVDRVLGGGQALGRRVRYVPNEDEDNPGAVRATPWYEIVGVVSDLEANPMDPERVYAGLFHPLQPGKYPRVSIGVRMREGTPSSFIGRLRQITTEIDPTLRVSAMPMAAYHEQQVTALRLIGLVLGLVIVSVLLLSAAGIYALMSFTVSQRRHEIGIRAALGGDPRRILGGIFSRALRQLGGGLALGLVAVAVLDMASGGELLSGRGLVLLPAVCLVMGTVGLLAALGPARRGLRIQPMEALREE